VEHELGWQPKSRSASEKGMAWCTTCQAMRIRTCCGTMMGVGRPLCYFRGGRRKTGGGGGGGGGGETAHTVLGNTAVIALRSGRKGVDRLVGRCCPFSESTATYLLFLHTIGR